MRRRVMELKIERAKKGLFFVGGLCNVSQCRRRGGKGVERKNGLRRRGEEEKHFQRKQDNESIMIRTHFMFDHKSSILYISCNSILNQL